MSKSIRKEMPHDLNAEAAVLSAMMISVEDAVDGLSLLKAGDFYRAAHSKIYTAIESLIEQDKGIDLITVISELDKVGHLDQVGGKKFMNELSDISLSGSNIEYHADIVLDKSLRRSLIKIANRMIEKAHSSDEDPLELLNDLERKMMEAEDMDPFKSATSLMMRFVDEFDKKKKSPSLVTGIRTGYGDLDKCVRGLRPGNLVILAARPSMGKTALASNICAHAANQGYRIGHISLEMSDKELMDRFISSESGVYLDKVITGYNLSDAEVSKISDAAANIGEWNYFIDDSGAGDFKKIRVLAKRKSIQKKLDLLVIDYMQLMHTTGYNRETEISQIARGLKLLAKNLEIPIIALSQLNRKLEDREDKRPRLSDLRESGAIEQDADVVMFIYRDEVYHESAPDTDPGEAEVIIAKNRQGPTKTVPLYWQAKITKFGLWGGNINDTR